MTKYPSIKCSICNTTIIIYNDNKIRYCYCGNVSVNIIEVENGAEFFDDNEKCAANNDYSIHCNEYIKDILDKE